MRLYSLLVILCLVGCQKAQLSKQEMHKILRERNEKLGECFKSGDAKKISLMYSDSAKLCPDGSSMIVGREAIFDFWKKDAASSKLMEMHTQTLTVDGDQDFIYETGVTTVKTLYKDSVYDFKVKFANIWKRQTDGSYLLDVDIWNKP